MIKVTRQFLLPPFFSQLCIAPSLYFTTEKGTGRRREIKRGALIPTSTLRIFLLNVVRKYNVSILNAICKCKAMKIRRVVPISLFPFRVVGFLGVVFGYSLTLPSAFMDTKSKAISLLVSVRLGLIKWYWLTFKKN